jgi:hypothetical protein
MSLSSALHPRTSTSVSSVVHVILTSLPPHPISSPPQSTRCVFLGYYTDHKGYGCLELSTNRLIVSRHVVFDEKNFPLAASPNLTDLDFLCESVSPISTIGTPVSFAGSSTALACQAAPIVPSGFEPHMTPMLVPLPAPRVPSGFLLHATPVPFAPRITAAGSPTGYQGGPPYTEAGSQIAPIQRLAVRLPPLEDQPPRGPPPRLLLRPAWVHHRGPG